MFRGERRDGDDRCEGMAANAATDGGTGLVGAGLKPAPTTDAKAGTRLRARIAAMLYCVDVWGAAMDAAIARLESAIEGLLAEGRLAGFSVGIVRGGALVYARAFGVRSLETREPVTERSLFHLASVSKPFVATALVQLADRGALALAAPVVEYLPYFRLADERYPLLTIEQLLSHVSGMPDTDDYGWDRPEYDDGALERYVRSLTGERLIGDPGAQFAYSNMAYEVLGDVIAKVSGRSFEDYLRDHILRPLAMDRSTFLRAEVPPALAVTPHTGEGRLAVGAVYPYNRAHGPSSTLHSNPVEMGRWIVANLRRGELDGARILDAASYDLLWHPAHATWRPDRQIGLSWFIDRHAGRRRISHDGEDDGFTSYCAIFPDDAAGVVWMTNRDTADEATLIPTGCDAALGIE
jgi:CubicO group peptidase (beta-lactamase class C family)